MDKYLSVVVSVLTIVNIVGAFVFSYLMLKVNLFVKVEIGKIKKEFDDKFQVEQNASFALKSEVDRYSGVCKSRNELIKKDIENIKENYKRKSGSD